MVAAKFAPKSGFGTILKVTKSGFHCITYNVICIDWHNAAKVLYSTANSGVDNF